MSDSSQKIIMEVGQEFYMHLLKTSSWQLKRTNETELRSIYNNYAKAARIAAEEFSNTFNFNETQ